MKYELNISYKYKEDLKIGDFVYFRCKWHEIVKLTPRITYFLTDSAIGHNIEAKFKISNKNKLTVLSSVNKLTLLANEIKLGHIIKPTHRATYMKVLEIDNKRERFVGSIGIKVEYAYGEELIYHVSPDKKFDILAIS